MRKTQNHFKNCLWQSLEMYKSETKFHLQDLSPLVAFAQGLGKMVVVQSENPQNRIIHDETETIFQGKYVFI